MRNKIKQKIILKFFVLFYFISHIFILKLDEPFRNEEIFIISFFQSKVQILVLGVKQVVFLHFFPVRIQDQN